MDYQSSMRGEREGEEGGGRDGTTRLACRFVECTIAWDIHIYNVMYYIQLHVPGALGGSYMIVMHKAPDVPYERLPVIVMHELLMYLMKGCL